MQLVSCVLCCMCCVCHTQRLTLLASEPTIPAVISVSYGEDEKSVGLDYGSRVNVEFQKVKCCCSPPLSLSLSLSLSLPHSPSPCLALMCRFLLCSHSLTHSLTLSLIP
jgi:hypothetical protein